MALALMSQGQRFDECSQRRHHRELHRLLGAWTSVLIATVNTTFFRGQMVFCR